MKTVLITGVGGYIGSNSARMFLENGYRVVGVDNLSRGYKEPLEILQQKYGQEKFSFYIQDIHEPMDAIFAETGPIDAVIHYAALCNVGESEKEPSMYFSNNVGGTAALVESLRHAGIKKIVFSSTCALYGEPQTETLDETHVVDPTSHPYGESKYMAERVVDWGADVYQMDYIFLRYFNVCGATEDGEFGDSKKPSFHLMQNAVRGALGIADFKLTYTPVATPDGSPIRDYVNVNDLNKAHLLAVEYLLSHENVQEVCNLGTGTGNSVIEIIQEVERLTGKKLSIADGERRKSDVSKAVASNGKITQLLGWSPSHSIQDSVQSLVTWYTRRPDGWKY